MLTSAVVAVATLAGAALAAPMSKRADIDTTILQYALTLEHLENKFYSDALAKYDAAAFINAGFPDWVRKRVVQIGQHEAQHVAFLAGALGAAATKPCVYSFPYTDVKSFLGLSAVIENVGVSAYLGAASLITEAAYVTAAASILTTEARHQAWLNSAVLKQAAWSGPEDTPLGFSAVYTIAAGFITSCPDTNPKLPVVAFGAATATPANFKAGDTIKLNFKTSGQTEYLYVYSGLAVLQAPISASSMVTVPASLQGISYGIVSTAPNATAVADANTIAGPIIMNFPLSSSAVSAAPM